LTMTVISETSFGVDVSKNTVSCEEYEQAFRAYASIFPARLMNPFLHNDFIYYLTPNGRKSSKAVKVMQTFTNNVIEHRISERSQNIIKKSLSDILLSMEDLTKEQIREQLDTFAFAGHDTTATTITFSLESIGRDERVQNLIETELLDIFGGVPDEINLEHLKRMSYTEAVIKETLRIYPPVPVIARKIHQDINVNGYTLTKGTDVWLCTQAMQTNETFFDSAAEFLPERFIDSDAVNSRIPFSYLPFSAGPRNCIGQRFAMNEIKIVLAQVLSSYKVKTISEAPLCIFEGTLKTKNPVRVKFEKR